jgi:hypothetical protein
MGVRMRRAGDLSRRPGHTEGPSGARLGRLGQLWRCAVTGLALAALMYGTIRGTDDDFPFGPMVQFAFFVDPDGEIRSTFMEADTTAGTHVQVRLSAKGVGIARAEIEGELTKIQRDPSLLQGIADAQRRLHPSEPQFTKLYLKTDVTQLRDGVAHGRRTETIAVWQVR